MIRKLYDWTMRQAEGRYAYWVLAVVAFVESSVFPIPPDVLIIPMVLAARHHAWRIALVATAASVAGGMLGYLIGYGFMDAIGQPILEFYGKADKFDELATRFNEMGGWAVLIAGVTPFPYKVITIFSGATHLDLWLFAGVSVLARALRFFVLAALLWKFGAPIRAFIERWLGLLFTAFVVLLIGGFYALRFL
ncbi:membrane protein YqaA with SNARE-associated domain [Rhodobacter aestuarii]|uniref:Membrane protein YqaA, SNARE-associated domain n=1 Tax=Rhodobacter aestuarii TaxID=453582 RepID=A0A1N7M7G4_9RHOB|nr:MULTISPECIES: YqaA family protein [Rhodobacter]PTV94898.1 membrane protein YqaA with SNARE-associated domain [Rhodobacter aestuarii]SIS82020.1 membrane protein YqaA, SNARE-associated domain [Rhodobacter aestuarii]SOC13886.1 membrane protein YqaA with SNARE-associated domain [Rhodobacter sp. JA431]